MLKIRTKCRDSKTLIRDTQTAKFRPSHSVTFWRNKKCKFRTGATRSITRRKPTVAKGSRSREDVDPTLPQASQEEKGGAAAAAQAPVMTWLLSSWSTRPFCSCGWRALMALCMQTQARTMDSTVLGLCYSMVSRQPKRLASIPSAFSTTILARYS